MKAMILPGPGQPLRMELMAMPRVGPNDVLVRVQACGVGLTVVKRVATPGAMSSYPRIPGHEIAGKVTAVGSAVDEVAIGQRVTCHFYLTCGQCFNCRLGRESLCLRVRGVVGGAIDGGYAEYVALPVRNVIPIPDGVSDLDAAISADAIATPYHACYREARVGPGDDILVIGAGGGVGIHMVQMARLCGGRVLAAEIDDEKLELARAYGADELIDARRGDIAEQALALTDQRGVDAVVDMVGARETLEASIRALAVGGRLVLIGSRPKAVYGEEVRLAIDPIDFQRRGLEIHASRYVAAAEIMRTLELVRRGRIRAVVARTFPLEGAEEAHELIRRNGALGRLALLMG